MITIDNNTLIGLAANSKLIQEFPFISQFKMSGGGCCGKKVSMEGNPNSIKMQIAYLPPVGQQKFKELTGWNKVRVVFESGNGTQTVVF